MFCVGGQGGREAGPGGGEEEEAGAEAGGEGGQGAREEAPQGRGCRRRGGLFGCLVGSLLVWYG